MLMLQTTFTSFSFCRNTEPKQTLKSQKLQQNRFVIPPASFNPHTAGAREQSQLFSAQDCMSCIASLFLEAHHPVPPHTVPPRASKRRRRVRIQTLGMSQGKITSCFSPLESGCGKTTCEGGLQPPFYGTVKSTNSSHPQSSPLAPML